MKAHVNNKYGRFVRIAVRLGGGSGNPAENMVLDTMIKRAKKEGVTSNVIENAIKAGVGGNNKDAELLEPVTYEASSGSVLFLVEGLTDNRSRTAAFARHVFTKFGAKMEANVAGFMFDIKGTLEVDIPKGQTDEDVALAALDAGALEFFPKEDGSPGLILHTESKDLASVSQALRKQGLTISNDQISKVPKATVEIDDDAELERLRNIIDMLEDNEDISVVWHNIV